MSTCDKCRFWAEDKNAPFSAGWCRRNAPSPVYLSMLASLVETITGGAFEPSQDEENAHQDAYWPRTQGEEWCGEFSPKPAV